MVKADPKRNYYADLEVAPTASTEEIKQQFRKLARIYHPDRNPGKEVEFVPKFQSIQAAHEILGDGEQRAKYDADRRRLGYNLGSRPNVPRAGSTRPSYRSGYASFSTNAPPPPPPQAPVPPRPNYYNPKPYSGGYSGYSAYDASGRGDSSRYTQTRPPTAARGSTTTDAGARAKAWQHFGPSSANATPPRIPKTGNPPRTKQDRQSSPEKASTAKAHPGLGRSNTTRSPRRGGFDPNQPGEQWEPAAPKSSSYVFTKPRSSSVDHLDVNDNIPDPRTSRESSARAKSTSPKNRKESTPRRKAASFQFPTYDDSSSDSSNSSTGIPVNESTTIPTNAQTFDFGNPPRTPFSATQWSTKFSGPEAFSVPLPSAGASTFRKSSRSRASPTRKTAPPPPISASRRAASMRAGPQPPKPSFESEAEPVRPPVKFSQEEWAEKFKDPSFLYTPTPVTQTKPTTVPPKTGPRTRSMSRSHETLSSTTKADGPSANASNPEVSAADSDAMEIDTPPVSKGPRLVPVPLPKSEWQTPKPSTTQPDRFSNVGSSIPFVAPTSIPPPPPVTPSAKETANGSATPFQERTTTPSRSEEQVPLSFNLSSIKDDLSSALGAGIANLTDLNSSLPFQSRPAPYHPQSTLSSVSPSTLLTIPKPPSCPSPPSNNRRLNQKQWKLYTARISAYMGEWYKYENKILEHFVTRHNDAAKFGTGTPSIPATRLIEARGEPEGGGLGTYMENRRKDRRVREAWNLSCARHELCVEEFNRVKETIRTEGYGKAEG